MKSEDESPRLAGSAVRTSRRFQFDIETNLDFILHLSYSCFSAFGFSYPSKANSEGF